MNKTTTPAKRGRSAFSDIDSFLGADNALAALARDEANPENLASGSGVPIQLPLEKVVEDPNQPRRSFSEEAMIELTNSIREVGVLQPITVRAAKADGLHVIRMGARRYRASIRAEQRTIPVWIEHAAAVTDDYAQMIENIQRDDLRPVDIAGFIERQLAKGVKQVEVARRLGKRREFVTKHMAYIDMPQALQNACERGLLETFNVAYEARRLYQQHPDVVGPWLEIQTSLSLQSIRGFAEQLAQAAEEDAASAKKASNGAVDGEESEDKPKNKQSGPTATDAYATGGPDTGPATQPEIQTTAVARCVVMVKVKGRGGQLVLDQICGNDQVLVKFEGELTAKLIDPASVKLIGVIGE